MKKLLWFPLLFFLLSNEAPPTVSIASYTADLSRCDVRLFWQDRNGKRIATLGNLRKIVEGDGKKILCMMNAGMFRKDFSPQGCFVENGRMSVKPDLSDGSGNFYLKPNGMLSITSKGTAIICKTEEFQMLSSVDFATQSGPMLVIDGKIHAAFTPGSKNYNIRNGVGILPDGNLLFAISETEINLYDFASFFRKAGCSNALYLDGFVSKAFIPSQGRLDSGGNFGPMVAVTEKH